MESLLLAVTGVSLAAALFLGWTAWRLSRAERERAMARVAALAAAAADPRRAPAPAPEEPTLTTEFAPEVRSPRPVPSRPRSSGRVASARPAAQEISWEAPRAEELPLRPEPVHGPMMGDRFLGSTPGQSGGGQRLLAAAAFVLLFALGAAGAWIYSTPSSPASMPSSNQTPLELLSMRQVREGDRLSVTGLIRNPASGRAVDRLSATVLLFDRQGGYLTSARAHIDVPRLDPGQESPFTLSVQAPVAATRYRVSFRTDERIVPHVDRRQQAPAAASGAPSGNAAAR